MKNTNLVEDVEDLASCQISSDCVQQFQRRCRKGLSQSEARTAILFFRSARKTQTWQRTLRSCFLSSFVKFHSAVSDEKSKMYQPIRGQGGHLVFPIGPKNTNLVEDVEILLPVKVRWIPFKRFQRRSQKCLSKSRSLGGHIVFPIGPKNTNLVENIEILLPVKFRWIPFSGFRGEVENVSANKRPGRPSCFSDRPEKHKFDRKRWDLVSCQVSLNSVKRFQRRSWKYEKLTTTDDGRTDGRTDDGRRTTHDHNSALEPSAQVH